MVWFADSWAGDRATGHRGGTGRAMQLGFNTNFRYRDVVFHVQTEDSGRANPHVITHVFHGGNIIASRKSDYGDLLAEDDLEGAVRRLMETQHKAMLKELSRGDLDGAIRERLGAEILSRETTDASASAASATGQASEEAPRPSGASGAGAGGTNGARGTRPSASSGSTPAVRPAAAANAAAHSAAHSAANAAANTARTPAGSERRDTSSGLARVFGDRVVSEKPLDEVVLDYLVENARKRKRTPKS